MSRSSTLIDSIFNRYLKKKTKFKITFRQKCWLSIDEFDKELLSAALFSLQNYSTSLWVYASFPLSTHSLIFLCITTFMCSPLHISSPSSMTLSSSAFSLCWSSLVISFSFRFSYFLCFFHCATRLFACRVFVIVVWENQLDISRLVLDQTCEW